MTDDSENADEPDDSNGDDLERAVEGFLDDVDTTLGEYDKGYADADATLQVLRSHLSTLREDVED